MSEIPAGDWLTVREAAARLGVSARRVQALAKNGRLPALRVGMQLLMRRQDVEAYRPKPVGRPKEDPPADEPKKGRPRR
jgi:excisionase family DNA binding protein